MMSSNKSSDTSTREPEESTVSNQQVIVAQAKKKPGPRKPTKKPKGPWVVEAIDEISGAPIEPKETKTKFGTVCGYVGREKVSIILEDWTHVSEEDKKEIGLKIMEHFKVPNDWVEVVKNCAINKAKDAWRTWKSDLHIKFMKKGKEPYEAYKQISKEDWEKFQEMKSTQEFLDKSKQHKALAAKNKHPHRMGVSGYYRNRINWKKEDEDAHILGTELRFSDVGEERCRDFLRARSIIDESGQIVFPNPADQELYQTMKQLNDQASQGIFQSLGSHDILTESLGTKESSGRARAIGNNVPHIKAFPLDDDGKRECKRLRAERKKQREKDELHTQLMPEVERMVDARLAEERATLEERYATQVEGPSHPSPAELRISCKSAGLPAGRLDEIIRSPVDNIRGLTKCKLQVTLEHMSFILTAAYGLVHPSIEGDTVDGVLIQTGFAKCTVNTVEPGFERIPLFHRGEHAEHQTLGEAVLSLVQWPKKDILLLDYVSPPLTASHSLTPSSEPTFSPQQLVSLHPESLSSSTPAEVLVKFADSYLASPSPVVKITCKSKRVLNGKCKRNGKSKVGANRLYPKAKLVHGYQRGEPFLLPKELEDAGFCCQRLHQHCMKIFGVGDVSIPVYFKSEHFLHEGGDCTVDFEDMLLLFNFGSLDASLMRCFALHLINKSKKNEQPVGFLDPQWVSKQQIDINKEMIHNYIVEALLLQQSKEFILLPYNENDHWILIIIVPKWNKAFYLDSLKPYGSTNVRQFLESAFAKYVDRGGRCGTGEDHNLLHISDYECPQQPKGTVLCGYYVCCHMMKLLPSSTTFDTAGLIAMLQSLDKKPFRYSEIMDVREQFACFFMNDVISENGEFGKP